jgi:protein SCO1/2
VKRVLVVVIAVLALACQSEEKRLSAPGEKLFTLNGRIVARDANDNTLRIDHAAIPGFMEAMTMDYSVRGAKVSSLPPDGSRITAKLHVTDSAYWVTDVRKSP